MRRIVIFLFILLLAGLGAGYWYWKQQREKPKDFLILFGNVDIRQVDLGFRVSGRIQTMHFDEGDFVRQNTLMATLNKQPYEDQVKQAQARVFSAKTSLQNAERLVIRRQGLVGSGAVSREDYEDAIASSEIAGANVQEAQASLGVSQTNYEDTEIYAPSDGFILTRIREPGAIVKVGDPVYTLSLLTPVWIRAYVTEPELGLIYPGMEAAIMTDTPNAPVYKGHIGFISPVAEFTPKTVETTQLRTDLVYRLRIIVDQAEGLRQGMPVTIHLPLKRTQGSSQ